MTNTMHITVASVTEPLFDGEGRAVSVPSVEGVMQVLPQHAPIIAVLSQGEVRVEDAEGKTHTFSIPGGLLEVSHNTATVLIREPDA